MVIVQGPGVGTLPAVTWKLVTPAPALLTTPVHVPPTVALAIESPTAPRLSLNVMPVRAAPVELEIVKVSTVVPPFAIVVGKKALAIPSLAMPSVALAVPPVPPFVDVTADVVLL